MPNEKDQNQSKDEVPEEKKYSFLQETIKPKPISRQQLIGEIGRVAVYGVILGLFACVGFFALKPWAQNWFKEDPATVTIPEDEEPQEAESENAEEDPAAAAEAADPVLDAESYDEMLSALNDIAAEAGRGVVSVEPVTDAENWTAEMTGIDGGATGVITADNGQELLILSDDSVCADASAWNVVFSDGSSLSASLKMQDRNTGLAVFSVPRSSISESTWASIKVSVLGNSNLVNQGDSVIALGNMFGYEDGMSFGLVSSTAYKESFYDGECDILSTDISLSDGGTGVLFNMAGEVIGMISSDIWDQSGSSAANAYAISDLKTIIEMLANGQSVPYVGVRGITVTGELQESQGMPAGVYVVDVDPDSPAMAAGIQSGDIICQVSGESVSSIVTYQSAVLDTAAGQQVTFQGKRLGAGGYVDVEYTVTVGSRE